MMSDTKNDMMPMGMPPVMVDYEDFSQFMAQEDRLKEANKKITELEKVVKGIDKYKMSLDWDTEKCHWVVFVEGKWIDGKTIDEAVSKALNQLEVK